MQRLAVSALGAAKVLAGSSAAVAKITIKIMTFTLSVPYRLDISSVSVRVSALPSPMIRAHRLKCPRCLPSHQLGRIGCRGVIRVQITGAPWFDIIGYARSARLFKRFDDFKNATASAGA